ncbi:MAG TPA: O-antigen polymerase [Sedimentisphaerales bacterium]|nr:O-antigen polymerase [Sedimentisphaerales bacterium]HNU28559.1 O-antigen polymerase [Sedimentisphaerales bacterium]
MNPLGVFLLVWGTAGALYAVGVVNGMFVPPAVLTVASVLLSVATFSLGYFTWTLFHGLDARTETLTADGSRPLRQDSVARALNLALAAGGIALLLEGYRLVLIARHFDTTWFELATHPGLFRIRLVTFIQENLFQASGTVMLLSITNSLFSIGFVLLGVFLHLDRTRRKYVYLAAFLAASLTVGVIHLSRYETTSNILYLVFAYCFMRREPEGSSLESEVPVRSAKPLTSHFKLVLPIASVVLLFAVIDILLRKSSEYDQPNRLEGFIFHFYWYLASPLAAFNEFVTSFTGDYLWGQSTFFPLYKWLCRFDLVPEAVFSLYGERALLPYMANTYTYLRNFYEDFGILGVAVIPYLVGWAVAVVRERARRHFQYLNLYVALLLFIFFSFYNFFLISNQVYLQVLFGFVLFRYRMDPEPEKDGSGLYSSTKSLRSISLKNGNDPTLDAPGV